jgi:hypothetical protein
LRFWGTKKQGNIGEKGTDDPFSEYRQGNYLPEKFVYGMNCFFDRVYEEQGAIVAQKAYEELRKNPSSYTVNKGTSTYDIPGIPVLFGLKFGQAMFVVNKAVASLKTGVEFSRRIKNETKEEYEERLFVMCHSLETAVTKLEEQGKSEEIRKLLPYFNGGIQELISLGKEEISTNERMIYASHALNNVIFKHDRWKEYGTGIDGFLSQHNSKFWNIVVGGLMSTEPFFLFFAENMVKDEVYRERFPQVEDWKREVRKLKHSNNVSGAKRYEELWNEMRQKIIKNKMDFKEKFPKESSEIAMKLIPEELVLSFLRLFDDKEGLRESIWTADWTVIKFVFDMLVEDFEETSKLGWLRSKN